MSVKNPLRNTTIAEMSGLGFYNSPTELLYLEKGINRSDPLDEALFTIGFRETLIPPKL